VEPGRRIEGRSSEPGMPGEGVFLAVKTGFAERERREEKGMGQGHLLGSAPEGLTDHTGQVLKQRCTFIGVSVLFEFWLPVPSTTPTLECVGH
jgi:hypothetical protein